MYVNKENCSLKHAFEVLDVSSAGDCFYEAVRVGMAYNNVFIKAYEIKSAILDRMATISKKNSVWFKIV